MRLPHGNLASTRIALVVADGERNLSDAEKYIRTLPVTATLWLWAVGTARRRLSFLARQRSIPCALVERPHQTVRMAQVVVVLGDSPFSAIDIEILEDQGIAVEHRDLDCGKHRSQRRGA